MIGNSHTAYQQLVAELGLTLIPSYVAEPGELTYVLHDGTFVGDTPTWFSTDDHRSMRQVEREFAALAATVDPDDPWSHPDAVALDDLSVTSWLGSIGATPNVRRALEAGQLGLSSGSFERTSLLALLRKCASTPSKGPVLLRRVGKPSCRRGIGDRGAADGRRARRSDPAGLAGADGQGRYRRLHSPAGVRRDRTRPARS